MIDATDLEPAASTSRERMATRALSATVVVLLLAGTVGAVVVAGGSDPKPVPLATIQAAAQSTTAAKTATVDVTMTLESGAFNSKTRMSMRTDNVARTGEFHMVSESGAGIDIPQLEGLIANNRFVLSVPPDAAGVSAGKPWLGANLPPNAFGAPDDPMRTGDNFLSMLAGADGEVEAVGTEKIRGVDTTRYRVEIDMVKAQQSGAASQSALGFPTAPADESAPATAPADVWLDDQGRLRRFVMVLEEDSAEESYRMRVQTDAYDYDKPFTVTLPPADQVHEVATVGDAFKALFMKYAQNAQPKS